MLPIFAALVFLWQGCSAARISSISGVPASSDLDDAVTENTDRVQCLRQDNLDLVGADERGQPLQYILRQAIAPDVSAIGMSSDNTENDVHIFVRELLIRHLEANLDLKRVGETDFEFTLTGNNAYKDTTGVGKADIWLSGFSLETQSKLITWATYLAANKEVLRQGQDGTLHFSLSGRVRATMGKDGAWEVDLVDTDIELFKFEFSSQQILETALNKWGGLDELLLQGIFSIVKSSFSPSVLASMRFIPMQQGMKNEDQDLWLSISLALTGSMERPNQELNLDTSLSVVAHVRPAKLIQVFTEQFNITELAEAKVESFLSDPAVQKAWENNRPGFVGTLKQYRFLAGDLLDVVQNVTELSMLRPRLLKAAADLGDCVTRALQPFVRAYAQGKLGYTEEFQIMLEGNTGWDNAFKNGSLWASLRPSRMIHGAAWRRDFHAASAKEDMQLGSTGRAVNFAWIPLDLLDVLGLGGLLTAPTRGKVTGLKIEKASLDFSELNISSVALWNFLKWIGPRSEGDDALTPVAPQELMEITNAELADISLRLPSILKPTFADISLTSSGINGELTSTGVLTLSSLTGFEANLNEKSSEADEVPRREGSPDAIDGPIEQWVSRPSEDGPGLSRKVAAQKAAGGIYLKISGSANGLSLDFQAKTRVTTNLGTVLGSILAGRPTEDFGYAFFAEHLVWERTMSASGSTTRNSVAAVLSCGYLRLLEFPLRAEPLARLDMNSGQLQLDIAKYTASPEIVHRRSGPDGKDCCVNLYTSGYAAPTVGKWWSRPGEVQDALCGGCQKIHDLGAAIALQVRRFHDPRATAWGLGTHNATEAQFVLPEGRATMDLVAILFAYPQKLRSVGKPDPPPRSNSTASTQVDVAVQPTPKNRSPDISTDDKVAQTPVEKAVEAERPSNRERRRGYVGDPIQKPSSDALMCRAEEDLDAIIFPPEKYGSAAIRMSIPESPLKDIHIVVEKIQVMNVAMEFHFKRVSDESFLFEIGTAKKHAKVDLWVEGVGLDLPHSKLDEMLKFGSGLESLIAKILCQENMGRLDRGPLNLDLYIKGEFSLSDAGRWEINPKEAVSVADIRFGAGGILQAVINFLVAHFGNMNKIFADIVWPLITSLIPDKVGLAFTKVPRENGKIDTKFIISAQCKDPVKTTCPEDEVTLNFTTVDTLSLKPEPIIKDLIETQYLSTDSPASLFMQAWEEGKLPLKSSIVQGSLDVSHSLGDYLHIQAAGSSQLNMALLETVLGKNSLLLDIIPGTGELLANGRAFAQLHKGAIDLPKLRIEKARLPFAIGAGDVAQALELDVTLQNFQAQMLNESKSDIRAMDIHLDVHADREQGFYVRGDGKKGPPICNIAMDQNFMQNLLDAPATNWTQPANARSQDSQEADGKLPRKFRKRFGQQPSAIDLNGMLQNSRAIVDVSLEGLETSGGVSGGREKLKGSVAVTVTGTLKLGSSVWKDFTQRHESDTGFVHFSVAGTYKDAPALLEIGCGRLVIYKLGTASPRKTVLWEVELANVKPEDQLYKLTKTNNEQGEPCLFAKISHKAIHLWKKYDRLFCPQKASDLDTLVEALDLQFRRFNSHLDASERAAQEDEKSRKEAVEAGLGMPKSFFSKLPLQRDTTWFRRLNPYDATSWYPNRPPPEVVDEDVETPLERWQRAEQQMGLSMLQRLEQADGPDELEQADGPEQGDRPEQADGPEQRDGPERADGPEQTEGPEQTDGPEEADRPGEPEQAE